MPRDKHNPKPAQQPSTFSLSRPSPTMRCDGLTWIKAKSAGRHIGEHACIGGSVMAVSLSRRWARGIGIVLVALLLAVGVGRAEALCDTLDGPVVKAAQQALDSGNVNLVLIWVKKSDEPEIVNAFHKALEVRKFGPAARELADRFFFETLVRIHRAGEGAPFTGLKPAGTDLGPAIPAADNALQAGSPATVERLLDGAIHNGLGRQFERVTAKRKFDRNDVAAGRAYVEAYVQYIHYVERI